MRLGVIADDFTGATDIAGFLVQNGLCVLQASGSRLEEIEVESSVDAIVVSLKSRSCPKEQAVQLSLCALSWLRRQGSEKIFFKYCSTFDSTQEGNIGPVADALLEAMQEPLTVICPALPVNLRTVYKGQLFVGDLLLHESHMKNHPLNPMRDSNLMRLIEMQSVYKAGLLDYNAIQQGSTAISLRIKEMESQGCRYIVTDTICNANLNAIAQATWQQLNLFTGGSGLGGALAKYIRGTKAQGKSFHPARMPAVVLSGSCSQATLQQIASYKQTAPYFAVDVCQCAANPADYASNVLQWFQQQAPFPAPLVYASAEAAQIQEIQQKLGAAKAQETLETFFAAVAEELAAIGVRNFIVAGGETAGVIAQALNVTGFFIGEQIAPGVPWVQTLDKKYNLALKSGNFGDIDFFQTAQELCRD